MSRAFAADSVTLPFANGERPLARYPQKRPLIVVTQRPPQLETPFEVYNDGIVTPNDAFFVRYHLAGIPSDIDPATWRLSVKGRVQAPLSLSLADLKQMDAVEYYAVNQCSGNSRGFFEPRVAGGQLGNGAMGNAKWRGVPLRTVLRKAGVLDDARQVKFDGLDVPAARGTPDFVKALDVDHATDGEVLLAYAMNGEDLPFLNGYPVRLVVPGWYGTYWVKHLSEITVLEGVLNDFWMSTAYRIPDNACACVPPGSTPARTVPIGRFDVRSFVTSVRDGARVPAGAPLALRGIAFDGGYGIREVAVSVDGGKTWMSAALSRDYGKYSFREWQTSATFSPGEHRIMVRAVNSIGQSQPPEPLWNPAGYMRNVVETVRVRAA
ncbi:MAG TPA: molybdopterin-dependent oxidoreductase [Casimicrobiaceae bacterium]|nr:molybdopterin-dependent oxidoreductase [Casimicrobiaceae bacterium]